MHDEMHEFVLIYGAVCHGCSSRVQCVAEIAILGNKFLKSVNVSKLILINNELPMICAQNIL